MIYPVVSVLVLSLSFQGVLGQVCRTSADCTRGDGNCVDIGPNGEGGCMYGECYAGFYEAGAYTCGVCPAGTTSDPNSGDPTSPPDAQCYLPCADGTKCFTPYSGTAACTGSPSTCVQTCNTAGYVVNEGNGPYAYCAAPPSSPSKRANQARAGRFQARTPW
ncbi:hypothetical protein DACRYDRAFT_21196 [Dacryopinax primogenitus]|uniref:Tyrosine-protein kinase ephrin type A/B receptor-like domain-containing protein n=1 Tax=Dacryopinax primogenitus (strain DJM 731) TaxID=1858805 RepID=M5GC82_DACPD|nr:uncharacterized protein DACRYDRAFT_21196 [Dacryopinax primogenitus]EJU03712.1 hypothetical protein DACRYDRAFT_21196 [Dacryopinax primogenitus]